MAPGKHIFNIRNIQLRKNVLHIRNIKGFLTYPLKLLSNLFQETFSLQKKNKPEDAQKENLKKTK